LRLRSHQHCSSQPQRESQSTAREHPVAMYAGKLDSPLHEIERDRHEQPAPCELARYAQEQADRRAEVNSQTSCAHRDCSAEQNERPFRLLVADQRERALQRKPDFRPARHEHRNRDGNDGKRRRHDREPLQAVVVSTHYPRSTSKQSPSACPRASASPARGRVLRGCGSRS